MGARSGTTGDARKESQASRVEVSLGEAAVCKATTILAQLLLISH